MFNSIAQGLLDLLVCTEMIDTCYRPNPVNSSMEAKKKRKENQRKSKKKLTLHVLHSHYIQWAVHDCDILFEMW
jgi:hypothetical protein